jgi:hypothetical protein
MVSFPFSTTHITWEKEVDHKKNKDWAARPLGITSCSGTDKKNLSSLRSKTSSGYDEISMKTLKISAPYISSPLCYIFNKAVLTGNFSLRMKY